MQPGSSGGTTVCVRRFVWLDGAAAAARLRRPPCAQAAAPVAAPEAAAPPRRRAGDRRVQRRPGHLRQRGRGRHRRGAVRMSARRQLPRRRPGHLEPQDRRGPRRGQCRRRQPARATADRRQRRADRHAARRDDRESAGRARKRRPHRRRRAARAHGDVTTLDNAVYSPCPVIDRAGCPQQPELADHRRPGHPRSGAQAQSASRAAGCSCSAITLPLLPIFSLGTGSDGGGSAACWSPTSASRRATGLEVALPYYRRFAPNRDLTLTPHVYTEVAARRSKAATAS